MKKQIFNPYLPSYEYIPDGEPHLFGDRLYLFGSHDKFNGNDYCENDYVCWSAPAHDLSDWRYEGVIYKKEQHPYKIGRNILFAPDVTKGLDSRYYLYYSIADSSIISVAVCDSPCGQYEYYGDVKDASGHIIGTDKGEYFQFDPGVLVDGGRIYLYSGYCPNKEYDQHGRLYMGAHVTELEKDMITIKTKPKIVLSRDMECPEGAKYFEAPSVRKIKDLYYLVYSARVTGLHYCTSKYPDRDFIYRGRIHSTSDVGINGHSAENPAYPVGNTHGGIECIQGKYYIFNHRFSNNTSYCRQAVAEQIQINDDGNISQVEATSCGLNDGPLIGTGIYPAYIACNLIDTNSYDSPKERHDAAPFMTQDGEDRECEPGQYLASMKNGCIAGYKYFQFDEAHKITVKVRGHAIGSLKVCLVEMGSPITVIKVAISGHEWMDISAPFYGQKGKQALFFEYEGDGKFDMLSFEIQ